MQENYNLLKDWQRVEVNVATKRGFSAACSYCKTGLTAPGLTDGCL